MGSIDRRSACLSVTYHSDPYLHTQMHQSIGRPPHTHTHAYIYPYPRTSKQPQRVILKYIESEGKDPATGEELTADDLIPIKSNKGACVCPFLFFLGWGGV